MGEHPDLQEKYNEAVVKWEEAFDKSTNGRVLNSAKEFSVPVRVVAEEATEQRGEELLGVFWPDWKWTERAATSRRIS